VSDKRTEEWRSREGEDVRERRRESEDLKARINAAGNLGVKQVGNTP